MTSGKREDGRRRSGREGGILGGCPVCVWCISLSPERTLAHPVLANQTRRTSWIATAIALVACVLAGSARLQAPPRVGYIDTATLIERYEGAISARQRLDSERSSIERNVAVLRSELDSLRASAGENPERPGRERIVEKEQELNRYTEAAAMRLGEREREMFEPVLANLDAKVANFARDRGIDLVIGTTSSGNVLFGDEAADLTEDFLEYMGAGS